MDHRLECKTIKLLEKKKRSKRKSSECRTRQRVSYKTKYATTIWLGSYSLGHVFIPEKWMFTCFHKNSYTDVYRSLICYSQSLETTQMAFSGWMVKQSMMWNTIHLQKGMNHTIHTTAWMNLQRVTEWKEPIPKGYILPDSIYTTFLKWQNKDTGNRLTVVRD